MAHSSLAQPVRKELVLEEIDPPFHFVRSSELIRALERLETPHRAAVLLRLERIAELASYGKLRGGGRFTVDSTDLLESVHVIYEIDQPAHEVVFTTVDEPLSF